MQAQPEAANVTVQIFNLPIAWCQLYCRPGLANKFTFTCGLKKVTSQAYVHVEEENNAENVAFMGLNLSKYIQDPALLRQHTWEGTESCQPLQLFGLRVVGRVKQCGASHVLAKHMQHYRTGMYKVGYHKSAIACCRCAILSGGFGSILP